MEEKLNLVQEWDKTFPKSEKVNHRKVTNSKYTDNKELMIIPNAVHTDLYDNKDIIPFDKIETFFKENLK